MPRPPVLGLLAIVACLAWPPRPVDAATIAVTTTVDELNTDGDCALREAVLAANTNLAVDACPAGQNGQTDTITVPAGTYTLTVAGDDEYAAGGDLDLRDNAVDNAVADDLVISGAGAMTTIIQACAVEQQSANCPAGQGVVDRVFDVHDASVAMNGITVRHGRALPVNNTRVGLGIRIRRHSGLQQPALALTDVVVTKNGVAFEPDSTGSEGGGIANREGRLTLTRVTVSDNVMHGGGYPVGGGGGILNVGGGTFGFNAILVMTDSTVSGNATGGPVGSDGPRGGDGGGINNRANVTATLTNCTISGNEAGSSSGGGISNLSGSTTTLTNCTVSGNSALGSNGGGIVNSFGGTLNLRSSTVTLNRLGGHGVSAAQGSGGIDSSGSVLLRNSIVAGNIHDVTPADIFYSPDCDDGGNDVIESEGHSIVGNANQCGALVDGLNGDQIGTSGAVIDAMLGPLADNGGLTLTHALLPTSPASDAADPATPGSGGTACPATDQRGETRPDGIACDVGSVESGGGSAGVDVDAVKPAVGGNAGTVQAHVYGRGFVAGATVKLVRAGFADVVGTLTSVGVSITTSLDLRGVAPGTWSVVVENPDASSATLADAFTIQAGGGADLWATILLPRAFLQGRFQSIYVIYGNRGTVDAYGVPLWLSFPDELEFHVPFPVSPPPAQAGQVATDWTRVAIDAPIPPPEDRDSFPFLLPVVPAGSTGALKLRIKSPPGPEFCQGDECVGPGRLPFRVTADIGTPYFKPDLSAEVVALYVSRAKELAAPDDGTVVFPSDAVIEAYVRTQLAGVVANGSEDSAAGGSPPIYSQTQLLVDTAQFIADASTTALAPASVRYWLARLFDGLGGRSAEARLNDGDCGPFTNDQFCELPHDRHPPPPPPPCTDLAKFLRVCNTDPPVIKCDRFNFVDEEYVFVPCKPKNNGDRDLVGSLDPNDKVGPGGAGGFIDGLTPLPYAISFENLPTATADALEVTVTDQLDVAKYDLATFSLGPITFGTTFVPVPPGLTSFSTEVDLRPGRNILVGIDAALDAGTGIVTWKFTTLDPATHQFPEDPDQGFLPPNVTSPDGEGAVLFTVNLKPGFGVGTTVCNDARIVFDLNAPIDTPEFCNTIGAPAEPPGEPPGEPPVQPPGEPPVQPETNCGNCLDDDGDGLTDFEDPNCCSGSGPALSLQRGLMKPAKAMSQLLLKGALAGTTPDVTASGLAVQLRPPGGGELLCARIAPGKFRRKGKAVRFNDKKGRLAGAGGLTSLLLKSGKNGSVVLALAAKKVAFTTPPAGPLTITFGFGDGTTAGQCAAVTPTFRAKKRGAIVMP